MSGVRTHTYGFVLHARPFRDNSRILDLLTEAEGRTACLYRGRAGNCRAFACFELLWQGRGELKTLSVMEEQAGFDLPPGRLACGFYLNELTLKLLPRQIPMEGLVAEYGETLARLMDPGLSPEPPLRRYELQLLRHLGEGLDSLDPAALDPQGCYVYEAQRGLRPARATERARGGCIHGETLQALLDDSIRSGPMLREARRLLRGLLDFHLQGKPILSRALLHAPRAGLRPEQEKEPNDES